MMRAAWVALWLLPATAQGAGFYIADIGARGMARAGAFVANPDSLLAVHYNPAGLSLLKGLHFEVSGALVSMNSEFDRSCPCVDPAHPDAAALDASLEANFEPARTNTPLVTPFAAIGYGFEFLDLTIAAAFYGPASGRHNFGELPPTTAPSYPTRVLQEPQRYRVMDVANIEANGNLSVALRPLPTLLPGLRLGGSLLIYATSSNHALNLWTNFESFVSAPEDPRFDVPVVFTMDPTTAVNWALGASYEVIEGLSLGASFRAGRTIRGRGKIAAGLPRFLIDPDTGEALLGAKIEGEEADVETKVAPIVRAGIQYAMPDVFKAEATFVWEGWSVHQNITLRPDNVRVTFQDTEVVLPELVIQRQWRDTYSLRFGGELNLWEPWIGIQAGYYYEPSAIPDYRVDAARIDLEKHGVSLGLSTQFYGITVRVSGMFIQLTETVVSDSEVQLTRTFDPPVGSDEFVTTVSNGRFSGRYFIGALSLGYQFGG